MAVHALKKANPEPYMGPAQTAFFRNRILEMRKACLEEIDALRAQDEGDYGVGDEADVTALRTEAEMRATQMARLRRTLVEIDAALARLESGEYGYCEETGEEIGLERLRINPLARYTVDVQERKERLCKWR